jgi:hypothetical protein
LRRRLWREACLNPAARQKTSFIRVISGGVPPSYGFILCIALPESQDRAWRPTARADPSPTRTRQHITVSVIVPAHEIALDGVLTEHHRHRVVDVGGRDVAMRVHVFQSLNESLFGSIHHFHPKMIPSADLRKGLARRELNEPTSSHARLVSELKTSIISVLAGRVREFDRMQMIYYHIMMFRGITPL